MEKRAEWMWYFGDFELYYSMKQSMTRNSRGVMIPVFWEIANCSRSARFKKTVILEREELIKITVDGFGSATVDGKRQKSLEFIISSGEHTLEIFVCNQSGIPAVFVESENIKSGCDWLGDNSMTYYGGDYKGVGTFEMYDCNVLPSNFELPYTEVYPELIKSDDTGYLYDFKTELNIRLITDKLNIGEQIIAVYGESIEEAQDSENCILYDEVTADKTRIILPMRACRYVHINKKCDVSAMSMQMNIDFKCRFACNEEILNKIYKVSLHNYELTSNLFFLDGIKRDGWIWGGDSFQSCLFCLYSCFDTEVIKRTIIALRGRKNKMYVNGIVDYTFLWFMLIDKYYLYTKDDSFIFNMYEYIKSLADFCLLSCDKNGLIETVPDIWTFVDWSDMTKEGEMCIIQMLFSSAMNAAAKFSKIVGDKSSSVIYANKAKVLKSIIEKDYWNEELGGFITTVIDGKPIKEIRRHQNIMAVILGFADKERKSVIKSKVINNENIPKITTPYFKMWELGAKCILNQYDEVKNEIKSYWGGMLSCGATAFWEEYDQTKTGIEHYEMYGNKFEKSLCHAWGASPLYIIGKFFAGVYPIDDGYEKFVVEPHLAGLDSMNVTVPINNGYVSINIIADTIEIYTESEGGTYLNGDISEEIIPNIKNTFVYLNY